MSTEHFTLIAVACGIWLVWRLIAQSLDKWQASD